MKYIKTLLVGLACLLAFGVLAACGDNQLETPKNLRLIDDVLTWDEVEGAEKYLVAFDGKDYIAETNSFDIFELAVESKTYRMSVMALGNSETTFHSEISQELEYELQPTEGLLFSLTDGESGFASAYSVKAEVRSSPHAQPPKGKVVIPAEYNGLPVTELSEGAFQDCTEITGIVLPDSIISVRDGKALGECAFSGCTNLKRIRLSESFTAIHIYMFEGCTSLTEARLPENLQEIGSGAFEGCTSLTEVRLPDGILKIGHGIFNDTGISEVTVPASVNEISGGAFTGAGKLQRLTVAEENPVFRGEGNCIIRKADNVLAAGCASGVIPNGVVGIGNEAFRGCTGLTRFEIPEGVREIESKAFLGCSNLAEISLPESLTAIRQRAFSGCTGLTQIKIPGVERLSSRCFDGCSNLTAVTLSSKIKKIDSTFSFEGCVNLTSITMDGEGDYYAVEGNCIIQKADNLLIAGCKGGVIPDYVEGISSGAFQGVEALGDFTIPYGVTYIGNNAFNGCLGLTSIRIPDSVKKIGISAFQCCFDLTSVVIPESVEEIERYAFEYSGTLYIPFETIPDGWDREKWAKKDPNKYFDGIVTGCKLAYENHYPYVESFTFDLSEKGALLTDNLIAPNRAGYTFLGWATEPDGNVQFGVENVRIYYKQMGYTEFMPGRGVYAGYIINGVNYMKYDKAALTTLPPEVRAGIENGTTLYAVWQRNAE